MTQSARAKQEVRPESLQLVIVRDLGLAVRLGTACLTASLEGVRLGSGMPRRPMRLSENCGRRPASVSSLVVHGSWSMMVLARMRTLYEHLATCTNTVLDGRCASTVLPQRRAAAGRARAMRLVDGWQAGPDWWMQRGGGPGEVMADAPACHVTARAGRRKQDFLAWCQLAANRFPSTCRRQASAPPTSP